MGMQTFRYQFLKYDCSLDPDDKDTGNHFGDQYVYGIVTRLIYRISRLLVILAFEKKL